MSGKGPIKITDTSEIAVCTCMQSNHWPFIYVVVSEQKISLSVMGHTKKLKILTHK